MSKWPTLYKQTRTGADQFWQVWTDDNTIVTRWGQVDGKVQETRDVISKGKNSGRSNATTPAEQAFAEAESHWKKKKQRGYVETLTSARAKEVDDAVLGGVFPMLAQDFEKHRQRLVYPCYAQPKFDGHRCIAVVDDIGACTLWTRGRKPITGMNHIASAIEAIGLVSVTLDGELYNHEFRDRFEELSSFIRDSEAR
ncbi:MAG: hypothetical protein WC763_06990, partial [Candidatus Paceibacterota bacterium]